MLLLNIHYAFICTDPNSESRSGSVYIPRDEAFGHLKSSDFLTYGLKSVSQDVIPALQSGFDTNFTPDEFDSFDDVRDLYEGGIKLPTDVLSKISPLPVTKEIFRTDGEQSLKFPTPKVIQGILSSKMALVKEMLWKFLHSIIGKDNRYFDMDFLKLFYAVSKSAWMTDEEFAREIVAGVNPGLIRCLQVSIIVHC